MVSMSSDNTNNNNNNNSNQPKAYPGEAGMHSAKKNQSKARLCLFLCHNLGICAVSGLLRDQNRPRAQNRLKQLVLASHVV